jgi:predicted dienelactone hydrolase
MKRFGEFSMEEVDKRFTTLAVRDAKKRKGRFPLIVFSHGNGGIRMQSIFLTEHLASHGYVVVAPDHTGNAAVACLPEGIVTINERSSVAAVGDRPDDVSFLIDEMTRQNADPKSLLHNGLDLDRVGVSGHSFGGVTATIATRDKRIKAILPLAGAAPAATFFHTPVMLMVADQDMTIGEKRSKMFLKLYNMWPAKKWLLEFKDAGHYTFSEMHRLKPDYGDGCGKGKRFDGSEFVYWDCLDAQQYIKAYGLAFFDRILRNKGDASKLLAGPSLSPKIRIEHAEQRSTPTATK